MVFVTKKRIVLLLLFLKEDEMPQVNEYALVKSKVMIEKYQEHEANDMKSWLKINPVLKMSARCQPHTSTFARK
jgi:hypothetical protein